MEQLLRAELRTSTLRAFGSPGAGGISEGRAYDTDAGPVFVKVNHRAQARQMFEGEAASLEALRSTGTVRAPRPIKVIDLPGGGAAFAMEHLKMRSLSSQASKLGDQVAELHLYNQKLRDKLREEESTVGRRAEGAVSQHAAKFGFHTMTCCGFIPQVNEWLDDWPTFFTRHRLQAQLDLIEKDYADREARELWSRLQAFLHCLPPEGPQSARVRPAAAALPALQLPKPLEPLRAAVPGRVSENHAQSSQVALPAHHTTRGGHARGRDRD
ncbi:fructosamine-3-kinase isoform X3 [Rousettus aegyptiacus]|uniref:fructosamine-3-kinase isoform X3 n=1 Tax=Rousettus aegyptiacus TaxID=9407 RepID=UPI00168D7ED0|nr:fructosamine-3-kinase isoform X3 [Rousettus aegyptiacus]